MKNTPHTYGVYASAFAFAFSALLYAGWLFGGIVMFCVGITGLLAYFLS